MLLDEFAPHPHLVDRHAIHFRASPEVAYRAIATTHFRTAALIKRLLLLGSLPGLVAARTVARLHGEVGRSTGP